MDIWIRPLLESLIDEEDEDALALEQGFGSWTEAWARGRFAQPLANQPQSCRIHG